MIFEFLLNSSDLRDQLGIERTHKKKKNESRMQKTIVDGYSRRKVDA